MLAWAVCALGAGLLAGRAASALLPPETAEGGARAVVWVAMGGAVALALSRSRPRGLLRVRLVDALYGVVFGLTLRVLQGVVAGIPDGPAPWPSMFSVGGALPESFVVDALADTLVAATLEELFFRGVVLICVYVLVRRFSGRVAAGIAAVAVATALFLVAHLVSGGAAGLDPIALGAVGVVTGAFVLGTGRIWPAIAVHVVFNASGYLLLAVGTLLA